MGLIKKAADRNKTNLSEFELIEREVFKNIVEAPQYNKNSIKYYVSRDIDQKDSFIMRCIDIVGSSTNVIDESLFDFKIGDGYHCDRLLVKYVHNNKYGYYNENGKVVIPCMYDNASNFHNNIALVSNGLNYGLIGKFGEEIVPVKYKNRDIQEYNSVFFDEFNMDTIFKFFDYTILALGEKTLDLYSITGKLLYSADLKNVYSDSRINKTFDKAMIRLIIQLESCVNRYKQLCNAFNGNERSSSFKNHEIEIRIDAHRAFRSAFNSSTIETGVECLKKIPNRQKNKIYNYVCGKVEDVKKEWEDIANIDWEHPAD